MGCVEIVACPEFPAFDINRFRQSISARTSFSHLLLIVIPVFALLSGTGCGSQSTPASPFLQGTSSQLSLESPGTVTGTGHPLVAEYDVSVPGGAQVSVDFGPTTSYGRSTWAQTAPTGGGAVKLLVAGMRADTVYHMRAHIALADGTAIYDTDHTFTTGALPQVSFPAVTVTSDGGSTSGAGVELLSSLGADVSAVVLDRDGSVIWYYYDPNVTDFAFPIRELSNGDFLVNFGADIREVDLAGRTVREVTLDQINAGLVAAGYSLMVQGIHHDALRLPNGHLILLVYEVRDFQDLPGYPGTTTVFSDALVDLDPNNQPVWIWRAFDHLDINRHPFMFPDWTHANALNYTPDGNLLLSLRHQSWIIKIDYAHHSGDVLWRLGPEGDFSLSGGDPAQWFYCQHFPLLLQTQGAKFSFALYDNGDTRPDGSGQPCTDNGTCYSRGIIMDVDESARTAQVSWQYSPGWYSFWGGSIALLPNGNVEFDSTTPDYGYSRVIEATRSSAPQVVWKMDSSGTLWYRAYGIPSLYPGVTW
jgi:arylsulfate sulfotransferase